MSQTRIDAFVKMLEGQPENEMIWYGLASEYSKLSQWTEAIEALRNVIRIKPDYTSAYQLLGSALASAGQPEEANRVWSEGVAVADRTGAWKAKQHMQGLLSQSAGDAPGFCKE